MTELYRRNVQFKRDLPKYRFALRKWLWRGKKTMDKEVFKRGEVVRVIDQLILEWEWRCGCWPLGIGRFFAEPPDDFIKRMLSWE
jgi:hypothetical protein